MSEGKGSGGRAGAAQKPQARRAARLAAVQALYQWQANHQAAAAAGLIAEYEAHRLGRDLDGENLPPPDRKLFASIVAGVIAGAAMLDDMIAGLLAEGWPLDRLDNTLRAILRCGAWELAERGDLPPKVVISEYVAIAALYYDDREIGMVNGLLDRLAHELRPQDMA